MDAKVTDLKVHDVFGWFFKSIQQWSKVIFHSVLSVSTPILQTTKLAGSKANTVDFHCSYSSCTTIPSPGKNLKTAHCGLLIISKMHSSALFKSSSLVIKEKCSLLYHFCIAGVLVKSLLGTWQGSLALLQRRWQHTRTCFTLDFYLSHSGLAVKIHLLYR